MAESPSLTPPRRRWLRFSLRTLLLFVLLIGSAATLWWNWGPWLQVSVISEPNEIINVTFDNSNQLLILYDERESDHSSLSFLDVRDVNGKRRQLFKSPSVADQIEIVGDYAILRAPEVVDPFATSSPRAPVVFDLRSLQPLDLSALEKEHAGYTAGRLSPHFLLLQQWPQIGEPHCRAVSLATCKSAGTFPLGTELDNDRLFVPTKDGFEVRDLMRDKIVKIQSLEPTKRRPNSFHSTSDVWILQDAVLIMRDMQVTPSQENDLTWVINPSNGREFMRQKGSFRGNSPDGHRLLIEVGSDSQLFDALSGQKLASFGYNNLRFTSNGDFLLDDDSHVYDAHTGALHWAVPNGLGASLGGGDIICIFDDARTWLADCRTRRTLMQLPSRYKNDLNTEFSSDGSLFVLHCVDRFRQMNVEDSLRSQVILFRLTRPWQWYGLAYLPEFWLTLVLGAGFLWSVWRDRLLGRRA